MAFPRHRCRGLIEAALTKADYHHGESHFRGSDAAASLKLGRHLAGQLRRVHFRGSDAAASLKRALAGTGGRAEIDFRGSDAAASLKQKNGLLVP